MTSKTEPDPASRPAERRSGTDRRRVDVGPPGRFDRRRGVEQRRPEVLEIEMSNTEWAALSDELPQPRGT
jgi:hypothetical protein